jgi:hypothetical protein
MGDAMGERVGLSGPGAGDYQKRDPTVPSGRTPCSTARRCSGLSPSKYEAAPADNTNRPSTNPSVGDFPLDRNETATLFSKSVT